jgi:hypothetical protein
VPLISTSFVSAPRVLDLAKQVPRGRPAADASALKLFDEVLGVGHECCESRDRSWPGTGANTPDY